MNEFLMSNEWQRRFLHAVAPGVLDEHHRGAFHGDEHERTQQPAVFFAIRRDASVHYFGLATLVGTDFSENQGRLGQPIHD